MKHLTAITRTAMPVRSETTAVETLIITFLSIFFRDWDNFASVVQNLSKFYRKT